MSVLDNIGGGNGLSDVYTYTCPYDGIEYRDAAAYSMHMFMEHNIRVEVGGVPAVPVDAPRPPDPTPIFTPPADPGPWPTDPIPVTPSPVILLPYPDPVYTPSPINPNPMPTTPVITTPTTGNGAGFSVGAMVLLMAGVLAIGRARKRKQVRRG